MPKSPAFQKLAAELEPVDRAIREAETSPARRMLDELQEYTPEGMERVALAFLEEEGDLPQSLLRSFARASNPEFIERLVALRDQHRAAGRSQAQGK